MKMERDYMPRSEYYANLEMIRAVDTVNRRHVTIQTNNPRQVYIPRKETRLIRAVRFLISLF